MGTDVRLSSLGESGEKLRTLFEVSPDPMFFKDGEGRWLVVNAAAVGLFDLQGIDYRQKTDLELAELQPAYRDALVFCKGSDEVAWGKAQPSRAEEAIPKPDGSMRVFDVIKIPLFIPDGRRNGLVVLAREITERRRAEQERDRLFAAEQAARAEAERHAEEAARAVILREEFIGIAAHELRTPLTTLQLVVQGLLRAAVGPGAGPTPAMNRQAQLCDQQVKRLRRLVDDLLEITRIRSGRLDIRAEPLDLGEIVRAAVAGMQKAIEDAGCQIAFDVASPVRGSWDRLALERIAINLVDNAAKYGRGRPIEIAIRGEGGTARLSVRDHGIGIPADGLDRIFALFERAVSVREYGGLGLGLYIVRSLAEAHGGQVSVESRPGEGATFTVTLPRSPGG